MSILLNFLSPPMISVSHGTLFSKMVSLLGVLVLLVMPVAVRPYEITPEDYLSQGDDALSRGYYEQAIQYYRTGMERLSNDEALITVLSLETNLATSLSSLGTRSEAVLHYQNVISTYVREIDGIHDKDMSQFAKGITSHAAFFLGMELQDGGEAEKAVDAYTYAVVLEPTHWSALANLGSVLQDDLRNHDDALVAYNNAYEILTNDQINPTDPPEEPRLILSQLQYRIGLCLNHDPTRRCALTTNTEKEVSCQEMATHAFSLAVQYDSENESAKHMLATVTADATMKRASNKYVKDLFDDYAQK
jgi:tetratricopeptide (TPR) repeat protein